jgi:hypothetical protein
LQLVRAGKDHQIQVFQGDCAQDHRITHHQRADEAGAVLEADFERADIGHDLPRAVGQQQLALGLLLQAQVIADALRYAHVQRGGVGERIDFQRQRRQARVAEKNPVHHPDRNPRSGFGLPR